MKTKRSVCILVTTTVVICVLIGGGIVMYIHNKNSSSPFEKPEEPVSFYMEKMTTREEHTVIPLLEFFEKIGAKIEWKSETKAKISLGDKKMTFILENSPKLEYSRSSVGDLLTPAPGSKNYCREISGKDVLVDVDSISVIFSELELPIDISIDLETKTVTVTFR